MPVAEYFGVMSTLKTGPAKLVTICDQFSGCRLISAARSLRPSGDPGGRRLSRASRANLLRPLMRLMRLMLSRLEAAHGMLCAQLLGLFSEARWDQQLRRFVDGWQWHPVEQRIDTLMTPGADQDCCSKKDAIERQECQKLAKLAAEKAWQHFLVRLYQDPTQRMSLEGWQLAMKGPKTGTRALALRQAAKQLMAACIESITSQRIPACTGDLPWEDVEYLCLCLG